MRTFALAALLPLALATPALAQRDPAYAAARAGGEVGEQPDGYLGTVGTGSPALHALVGDINIKRKAAYTTQAAAAGATVQQFAFTTGCTLIAQTRVGEKYRAPDGSWRTRTGAAPDRDARCP
jgi:hypothetical protein